MIIVSLNIQIKNIDIPLTGEPLVKNEKEYINYLKKIIHVTNPTHGDVIRVHLNDDDESETFTVYRKTVSNKVDTLYINYEFIVGEDLPEHKSWTESYLYKKDNY